MKRQQTTSRKANEPAQKRKPGSAAKAPFQAPASDTTGAENVQPATSPDKPTTALSEIEVEEPNRNMEHEMMSPKVSPKMSPSAVNKFASRQDFSKYNETDFMCEFASGGKMTILEVNTAIQEFVKGEDTSVLDQTNNGLAG